ncbi:MAG: membrane protein insertase YidC [Gemmatimonadetes bacterium]|nr:membrane protein insertase YidC [Gemmatimonadota bacterium]
MDRRLLIAIGLMFAVMALSNLLFPPIDAPPGVPSADSTVTAPERQAPVTPSLGAEQETPEPAREVAPEVRSRIVTVRSDLYEYRFDTRGARLVGATMREYESFAAPGVDDHIRGGDERVELVRDGDDWLDYRVPAGADTVSLADIVFTASRGDIEVTGGTEELRFSAPVGTGGVTFELTYRFSPDDYRIVASGGLRGLQDRGHTILVGLGRGLAMNEANEPEDVRQFAVVTRERAGEIRSLNLRSVDADEVRAVSGAPFSWAASKSKYWLAALVSPETGPGFGGVVVRGVDDDDAADIEVTLSVPAGSAGFEYTAYLGPQDFGRLQDVGQELHNANPFGWRWLQWFIRPFGNLMVTVMIWMHEAFTLAYGWVLILFGVISRIVLFPLYQISMRAQMKQMAIQPEQQRIQKTYKEDPQRMQQEMMKLYKEHGVNPLSSCLPMLLPFPILITLFFVFQNTIEFRGVPFLWLPDLSLKDPIYIVPLLMGGSMFLLSWIGQRGMEVTQQMKMFTYVLPVVLTFMFAQFAAGLNLYYAASNIASLPQQLYLARERRKARTGGSASPSAKRESGDGGSGGTTSGGPGSKPGRAEKPAPKKKSRGGPGAARRKPSA